MNIPLIIAISVIVLTLYFFVIRNNTQQNKTPTPILDNTRIFTQNITNSSSTTADISGIIPISLTDLLRNGETLENFNMEIIVTSSSRWYNPATVMILGKLDDYHPNFTIYQQGFNEMDHTKNYDQYMGQNKIYSFTPNITSDKFPIKIKVIPSYNTDSNLLNGGKVIIRLTPK